MKTSRHLSHVAAGSSIPIAGLFLSWSCMVGLLVSLCILAFLLEGLRLRHVRLNAWVFQWVGVLFKEKEWRRPTGATYMVIAALVSFLVFPREVAVLGLLFLSVGDPVATMVGQRIPRPRLGDKSPWGTMAFLGVAMALAIVVAIGTPLQLGWGLAVGATVAALAELSPDPLDDNLKVPLLSGGVLMLLT